MKKYNLTDTVSDEVKNIIGRTIAIKCANNKEGFAKLIAIYPDCYLTTVGTVKEFEYISSLKGQCLYMGEIGKEYLPIEYKFRKWLLPDGSQDFIDLSMETNDKEPFIAKGIKYSIIKDTLLT